ncbi:hypothetical protein WA158_002827 [Blastocystis sp. Blastoise]
MKFVFLLFAVLALAYDPTWESVDSRPLPSWFDEAKLGIFIHWSVFSVPAFKSEWYWRRLVDGEQEFVDFYKKTYGEKVKFQDLANQFTAEMYDPDHWADVFEKSGAKYVVLTSKHHEGFTLWPSKYSWNWNSQDIDKDNGFQTQEYVDKHYIPMVKELVNKYKPDVLWADGGWEALDSYWKSPELLAWLYIIFIMLTFMFMVMFIIIYIYYYGYYKYILITIIFIFHSIYIYIYNESPVKDTVVVNDRWGADCSEKHGGFYSGPDRYEPGHLLPHKWESAMTIQKDCWGYDRTEDFYVDKYFSLRELLSTFIPTVAYGGNLLLNIGPTADGRIMPLMQERLIQLGDWMKVNGEAIYKSIPWRVQDEDKKVYFTERKDLSAVYAILTEWPEDNTVTLSSPQLTENTKMSLMGSDKPVEYKQDGEKIIVSLPHLNVKQIPCQEFYVIKHWWAAF